MPLAIATIITGQPLPMGRLSISGISTTEASSCSIYGKTRGDTHNLSEDAAYQNKLSELRKMMVEHLSERGDSFVKDGKLMTPRYDPIVQSQFSRNKGRASLVPTVSYVFLPFFIAEWMYLAQETRRDST